jgi:hypothetical protein
MKLFTKLTLLLTFIIFPIISEKIILEIDKINAKYYSAILGNLGEIENTDVLDHKQPELKSLKVTMKKFNQNINIEEFTNNCVGITSMKKEKKAWIKYVTYKIKEVSFNEEITCAENAFIQVHLDNINICCEKIIKLAIENIRVDMGIFGKVNLIGKPTESMLIDLI